MADPLAALRASIDRFPVVVTAELRAVAWRTSREVKSRAQALVAKDTGYTAENIHIVERPEEKTFLVVPGSDRPRVRIALHTSKRSGRQHTQKVTLNMLPSWLEYGTAKMQARPFMRPAADAVEASYRRDMERAAVKAFADTFREP